MTHDMTCGGERVASEQATPVRRASKQHTSALRILLVCLPYTHRGKPNKRPRYFHPAVCLLVQALPSSSPHCGILIPLRSFPNIAAWYSQNWSQDMSSHDPPGNRMNIIWRARRRAAGSGVVSRALRQKLFNQLLLLNRWLPAG